jgi:hypothetical protein
MRGSKHLNNKDSKNRQNQLFGYIIYWADNRGFIIYGWHNIYFQNREFIIMYFYFSNHITNKNVNNLKNIFISFISHSKYFIHAV